MNSNSFTANQAASMQAAKLLERLGAATARRASDERRFTTALKREHAKHLSSEEAAQLARNMDAMLESRKALIGHGRKSLLCEKAFGSTSSRELYKLRLALGEDPEKKGLRRSFGPYQTLAQAIADMTGEPRTKLLRELVSYTRFDELQSKLAEWDRIDGVAAHLQDLVNRLNEEFGWGDLYQRTAEIRLKTGGQLTWPLYSNEWHEPSSDSMNESSDVEWYESKLRASCDPTRLYYSDLYARFGADVKLQYSGNDQLQSNEFFFVPHAKIGYIDAWNLPSRAEEPAKYQIEKRKLISNFRSSPEFLKEPEIGWNPDLAEPEGQLDAKKTHRAHDFAWLIVYPSPIGSNNLIPALYVAHEEGGPWLMPLDRKTLAALEEAIWFNDQNDSDLIERLETLLGADLSDGICSFERDLRHTGEWLAHNPVLKWEAQQQVRRTNMLHRARSHPDQR